MVKYQLQLTHETINYYHGVKRNILMMSIQCLIYNGSNRITPLYSLRYMTSRNVFRACQ